MHGYIAKTFYLMSTVNIRELENKNTDTDGRKYDLQYRI